MSNILFVDDDPEILAGLQRGLKPWRDHMNMTFVHGGASALNTVERQNIDLVVTDMAMPLINGRQLIDRLRILKQDMAFIVLSGQCDDIDIEALTDADVVFVAKPVSVHALMEIIVDALDELALRLRASEILPSAPPAHGSARTRLAK